MAVDLSDFVPALRREVTPPGNPLFDAVSDDVFTGYLADAFWEARLDGFLHKWSADEDGLVTPVPPNTQDLPRDQIAAIIVYAGIRVLRNQILNTNTTFRAKAGPVEYETQNGALALVEALKQLKATKDRLIANVVQGAIETTGVEYIDAYASRLGLSDQYAIPNGQRFIAGSG